VADRHVLRLKIYTGGVHGDEAESVNFTLVEKGSHPDKWLIE
jgi:hypothetical protein